jgi:secondary thiamine-phosphate synthase enzyme
MRRFNVKTVDNKEVIDITDRIEDELRQANVAEGLVNIFILHTTAAITTADLDPGTDKDMLDVFQQIIPQVPFRHAHDPGHTPDHIMSTLIGPGITVPVQAGRLVLGAWQRVILVELDGPRERTLVLSWV